MGLLIWFAMVMVVSTGTGFVHVNDEMRLTDFLVSGYSHVGRLGRPVAHVSDRWNVTLGLSLLSMTDVDVHSQTVEVITWQTMMWKDIYLKWSKADFEVANIRLLPTQIPVPDITLYNAAARPEVLVPQALVVVNGEGDAFYVPPVKHRFTCPIPTNTDQFTCSMKFGSWTYSGHQLNLTMQGKNLNLEQFTPNPEWELLTSTATRNEVLYECCHESYIDITYNITLRRK